MMFFKLNMEIKKVINVMTNKTIIILLNKY